MDGLTKQSLKRFRPEIVMTKTINRNWHEHCCYGIQRTARPRFDPEAPEWDRNMMGQRRQKLRLAVCIGVMGLGPLIARKALADQPRIRSQLPRSKKAKQAEAERHKRDAFRAIRSGNLQLGIEAFERAYRAFPHPTFLLNIALVYGQRMGRCQEALSTYDRFFAVCQHCEMSAAAKDTFDALRQQCVAEVNVESVPTGATVFLNEDELGKTPSSTEQWAGSYMLRVTLPGHESASRHFDIEPQKPIHLRIELVPKPLAAPMLKAKPAQASAREQSSAHVHIDRDRPATWPFWTAVGVSATSLAVGIAFSVSANIRTDEANRTTHPTLRVQRQEGARRQATRANVAYALSGAGALTALVLWILPTLTDYERPLYWAGDRGPHAAFAF